MSLRIRLPLAALLACTVAMSAVRVPADDAGPGPAVAPEPPAVGPAEDGEDTESAETPPAPEPAAPEPEAPGPEDTEAEASVPEPETTDDPVLPIPAKDGAETPDEPSADGDDAEADAPASPADDEEMTEDTAATPSDADATEAAAPAEPAGEPEPASDAAEEATTPAPVAPPATPQAAAKPVPPKKPVLVPGTGALVAGIGDDFEDEAWKWSYHHPKSSEEQDKRMRGPMGRSANGRWFEGPKRGTPDVVKRIELPAPGLEGSSHGLLIATLNAGIPGRITYQMQQDDLIYNMQKVTGRGIPVGDSPSVVTRVYIPPFEQWERRSGPTFGFRAGCYTHAIITGEDHPDRGKFGLEEYWPGMFICFEPANPKKKTADSAYLRIRGGRNGGEIRGPQIEVNGWWTLGLSFSADGMVHYFASPGVDALTMDDHITSQYPYGYRTEWLKTFFFNVCSRDDGKTWSTPWVIDDPQVSFVKRQLATAPKAQPQRFFRQR